MDQEHSSHLVPEEKAEPDTTDLIALHFSKGNQAYAGGIPTLPSLPSYSDDDTGLLLGTTT